MLSHYYNIEEILEDIERLHLDLIDRGNALSVIHRQLGVGTEEMRLASHEALGQLLVNGFRDIAKRYGSKQTHSACVYLREHGVTSSYLSHYLTKIVTA